MHLVRDVVNAECLNEMTYALTAYSHQNKAVNILEMARNLVSAPWHALHPLVCIKSRPSMLNFGYDSYSVLSSNNWVWFDETSIFLFKWYFKDKLRTMKAWSKYSEVLNDPVRNLNMRLRFQNAEVPIVLPHHLHNVRTAIFIFDFLFVFHSALNWLWAHYSPRNPSWLTCRYLQRWIMTKRLWCLWQTIMKRV